MKHLPAPNSTRLVPGVGYSVRSSFFGRFAKKKTVQFADIKNDLAFHKIFGNENRTEVLISFLNAVLDFEEGKRIQAITILNPYQLPKLAEGKAIILDLKATDQKGTTYLVEMQVAQSDHFGKRVLYYFSKAYSEQIKRGEFYEKLCPVIFIGILDFVFTQNDRYIKRSRVQDVETGENTLKDVEFTFIELPKFEKQESELDTLTDKWIYFIKNANNLQLVPPGTSDPGLRSAYQEANIHIWSKNELLSYDYLSMRKGDEAAKLSYAETKGKLEGKFEQQTATARELIQMGLDDAFIARATKLSIEQVGALRP